MQCASCGHQNLDGARFCASCGALVAISDPPPGADPMIGQLVGGRFRVTGVLGEGGMGVVYVGEQQMGSTVRKVAIKTLHPHLSKDPSVLARFHRECGTVAQLEHPNTIKVYDFGTTQDGTLYIAMEFVAGHPLSDLIQKGPMSPERVVKIMRQVCGALDEAHMQGIIHRDLKPENLILTDRAGETDFVKVLDFGIAARTESADAQKEKKLTQQGMVLGTPPYMSPEQFTGKALDARSDIYSLGVMVYEMLAGRLPFDADTPWQWATQHMSAQPIPFDVSAPHKNIPEGMRKAIMRALSKEREQRQSSAREFFAELSGGGRMTVEDPQEVAAAATAAMAALPEFGVGAVSPQPFSPVVAPAGFAVGAGAAAGMGLPGQHASPAFAGVPPGPSGGGRPKSGGKGLIVGLSAAGGLLLVAIVVVAARSIKPHDDSQVIVPIALPTGSPAATVASIAPGALTPPTTIDPVVPPAETTPSAPTEPAPKPPVATGGGTTTPPKPVAATGAKACDACIAAASVGNLGGAAANLQRCDDAAKKAQCTKVVKNGAPAAARAAALLGNCAQAKALIQAAESVGAGSGALKQALVGSSCK